MGDYSAEIKEVFFVWYILIVRLAGSSQFGVLHGKIGCSFMEDLKKMREASSGIRKCFTLRG